MAKQKAIELEQFGEFKGDTDESVEGPAPKRSLSEKAYLHVWLVTVFVETTVPQKRVHQLVDDFLNKFASLPMATLSDDESLVRVTKLKDELLQNVTKDAIEKAGKTGDVEAKCQAVDNAAALEDVEELRRDAAAAGGHRVSTWDAFLASAPDDPAPLAERVAAAEAGKCCTLIYTSGTTGRPKATAGIFWAASARAEGTRRRPS